MSAAKSRAPKAKTSFSQGEASGASTISPAPKGRNIPAQGNALGNHPTTNPSPEGATQFLVDWEITTIGEIAEINPRLGKSDFDDDTLASFVPMKCVEAESGRCVPPENKKVGEVKKGYTPMQDGDVIIAKVTPCMENGKAAVVRGLKNGIGFGSTEFYVLRPSERILPEFLFYFIIQQSFRREAERYMTGAVGLRRVPRTFLENHEIQLPPLPEQRRIVARIEELFSRLDSGVAALRQAKAQLQRYRQSVLAAAVTGQLTQAWREQHPDTEPASVLLERILEQRREHWNGRGKYKEPVSPNEDFGRNPSGTWEMASMDALTCHITSGSRDWTQYYKDDGYAVFVMAQNVRPQKFDSTPVIRVSPPEGDRDKVRSAVAQDDLLVTIVGANTGNVCRVDKSLEDYYVCQSVALLRPVETATAKYLDLYMNSEEHGQYQFDKWMYGAGRPHLSFDQLRSTAVFLPPLAEQHQIVAEVEARTTAIDHLEAELDRQITRSNRLRQSTLAAAFSGSLTT